MREFLALAGFFAAMIAGTADANAQSCAPRETVLEQLATRYGETRRAIGLAGSDRMMELFASDDTGSWTITVTLASGMTCLVASGVAYEPLADALPPAGKGA